MPLQSPHQRAPDLAAFRVRRRPERLIGIAATEANALVPLLNGDEIFARSPICSVGGKRVDEYAHTHES